MAASVRALSCRNYRLYFIGNLVSSIGTWIQLGAQGWLVLRLTGSGTAVGMILALQFLPVLVGGPWGGLIADRHDKRRVLVTTQLASVALVGVLALVTLLGMASVWMVLLAAFLRGCILLVEDATTEAFVGELVGPEDIVSAVSLNGAVSSAARIAGPAAAGILTVVGGEGLCFLVNAVSYLAVVVALLRMDARQLRRPDRAPKRTGEVAAALRHVRADRQLRSTLVAVGVVSAAAINFSVLLPILTRVTFGAGPETVGMLSAALGAGSLLGAVGVGRVVRPTPRMLAGAQAVLGTLLLGLAAAPSVLCAAGALVLVGAANMVFLSTANSLLQLRTAPEMKGRVMALYGVVFLGTTPVGALAAGWMAQNLGPRVAFAVGGLVTVSASAIAAAARGRRPSWPDGDEGALAAGDAVVPVGEVVGVTTRTGVDDDDVCHAR